MWHLCDDCLCCYDDGARFDTCPHDSINSLDFNKSSLTEPLPDLLKRLDKVVKVSEDVLALLEGQNDLLKRVIKDEEALAENVSQLLL